MVTLHRQRLAQSDLVLLHMGFRDCSRLQSDERSSVTPQHRDTDTQLSIRVSPTPEQDGKGYLSRHASGCMVPS